MGNFIVGGFLPGTNVQLSFNAWLIITSLFAVFYLLTRLIYRHSFSLNFDNNFPRVYAPFSQDLHLNLSQSNRYSSSTHQVLNAVSSSWIGRKAVQVAHEIYYSDWTYHQD